MKKQSWKRENPGGERPGSKSKEVQLLGNLTKEVMEGISRKTLKLRTGRATQVSLQFPARDRGGGREEYQKDI